MVWAHKALHKHHFELTIKSEFIFQISKPFKLEKKFSQEFKIEDFMLILVQCPHLPSHFSDVHGLQVCVCVCARAHMHVHV